MHSRVPWLIFGLALVLFTWKLGANDLWAPDEPYFAEGAREMLADGNWLVPHINGDLDNHKPPFFFWLIAWFGWLAGGITPLIARIPSVLAGLGALWLTIRLGSRTDPVAGRLAGLVLVTTYMFWDKARWAQTDAVLCFFILSALYLFDRQYRPVPSPNPNGWLFRSELRIAILFWISISLAFLTKGPIGLVLPSGIILTVAIWDRRAKELLKLHPLLGFLILLAIVGTWAYLATTRVEGYHALASVKEHFFERASQGMHHHQPFWYYGEVWTYSLLPWSFLFPGMLFFGWRSRNEPQTRFTLVWVVFTFLLFSLSTEKRDLYILPSLPAIALLMSSWLARVCRTPGDKSSLGQWARAGFHVIAGVLTIAAVVLPFVANELTPAAFWPATASAALLLISGLAIWWSLSRPLTFTLATVVIVGSVMVLGAVTLLYPQMEPDKSARPLATAILRELDPATRSKADNTEQRILLGFDLANVTRGINFHTEGLYLHFPPTPQAALELLATPQYRLLLANEEALRAGVAPDQWRQLDIVLKTRINRRSLVLIRSPSP